MNIDHKKFLFLTGAISAATLAATATVAGCTVNNTTTNGASDSGGAQPEESPVGDAGSSAQSDAASAKDAGDAAAACLGNATGMPICNIESDAGAICVQQCITFEANFKQEVTADIYACMLKLPSCEGDVGPCVTSALSRTCADSTAKPVCDQIYTTCTQAGTPATTLPAANCEALVRGLNTTGRNNFVSCMGEGGCLDPAVCINAL